MPITPDMSDSEIDDQIQVIQMDRRISDESVLEEAKEILAENGLMAELHRRVSLWDQDPRLS